jgi:hypothetical protein
MAKLCYENGLTKGPDIVSYIRLSMECLWQYINNNSQAEKDRSGAIQPQKENEVGVLKRQNQHQVMITPTTPKRGEAIEPVEEIGGEETRRGSLSYLEQYFHPVFEEINKLNKTLDSLIEYESDKATEKKKKK